MTRIVSLSADVSLSKSYTRQANGSLKSSNYPNVYEFTSAFHEVNSPADLLQVVQQTADAGHCLLKGTIDRPLVNESRAGSTSPTTPTEWLCLDIDGAPDVTTAEDLLQRLPVPFRNVSYVVQYSASHGIKDDALHCHIFILLASPQLPATLKNWLRQVNFDLFADHLTLRKNHNSLSWIVDDTTCQNDKLLYVAPPRLGKGAIDRFQDKRIVLHTKRSARLNFDFSTNALDLQALTFAKINQLRRGLDMPTFRKDSLRFVNGIEIQHSASAVFAYEFKEDRDFIRFNLNGGDSWGYFHPKDRPDVIYNFKGEPNYLTSELIPEYWAPIAAERALLKAQKKAEREALLNKREERSQERELRKLKQEEQKERRYTQARECPVAEDGYRYFAAIHQDSKQYYYGRYHPETDEFICRNTNQRIILQDWFLSHDLDVPAYYDEWKIEFRFDDERRIDFDERFINLYKPTRYMLRPIPAKPTTCPTYIESIIRHATGNDEESYNYFINWLAYIFQTRKKSGTAWVLHGAEGSGKGLIFEKIIAPILGRQYCTQTSVTAMADDVFNGFLEEKVFCLINESTTDTARNKAQLSSRMKTYITDDTIAIRKMHRDYYEVTNYVNFLVFSNEATATLISTTDRRWSVAKRQPKPLPIPTDDDIQRIADELPAFTDFIRTYPYDAAKACKPFVNEERFVMQELSMGISELLIHKIQQGDFAFLVENRPDFSSPPGRYNINESRALPTYDEVLDFIIDNPTKITRDHLEVLLKYIADYTLNTPAKVTQFFSRKGFHLKRIRVGNTSYQGRNDIPWNITQEALQDYALKRSVKSILVGSTHESDLRQGVPPPASQAQQARGSSRSARRVASSKRLTH